MTAHRQHQHDRQPNREAFTLTELLVVIAIIAILSAMVLPAVASARSAGTKAACLSNLREIGLAIHTYAEDFNGDIPWGPKAGPYLNPGNFYPSTGAPTSLLSLQSGQPVALGLLIKDYLASQPEVLFCPGVDQSFDAKAELAKFAIKQSQGSYFYRHGGNPNLADDPLNPWPKQITLDKLGLNRLGSPIRALAMDMQYLVSPDMAVFGVKPHTHHKQRLVNILYSDGHVSPQPNRDAKYTIDFVNATGIYRSFDQILQKFESADYE
jgi:prepilin-type N-terminal cleavage/methylation domain-containing protein/prepilin-type processing-associated H-X9-DG protein